MNSDSRDNERYTPMGMPPLRLCRVVAGWSQAELAARADVTRETVSLLETGKHSPRWRTAAALSRALGVRDPRLLFPEAFHYTGTADVDKERDGTP